MSSFLSKTKHPQTGKWETAAWLDDYFGRHQYGVKFLDGQIFNAKLYELPTTDDNVDVDWAKFFPQDTTADTAALSPPDHSQTSTKDPMPSSPKEAKPVTQQPSQHHLSTSVSGLTSTIMICYCSIGHNHEATALSDQVEYTCPECGSVKLLPKEQVQQWKEEITYED